ncbi:MAG: protease modulator HflC [Candidatus Zapsychrus exili]|nr:protease modulator HflC [Candidatus Zapsychrus exili]
MNKVFNVFIFIAILAGVLAFSGIFYTVDETQQVVVTQFGEPIGDPISDSGLHFKIPITQKANYFDKRILQWDGEPNQIPTRDKRYIWVDTMARWRIVDALKFMQSVRTENSAHARLDDVIDAATRDVISGHNLSEAVRSTNRLLELSKDLGSEDFQIDEMSLEHLKVGRDGLNKEILRKASEIAPNYGIELIDVKIKRINYVREVRDKVYDRMISERRRAAEKYRSEGQGKKAEIEGKMAKELEQIRSDAYKEAEEVKGVADAEAIKIYAEAYNKDPEFYSFVKTLESYEKTLGEDTTLILSTDNEFFKRLDGTSLE